ncbi:hypothetical protein S245_052241, partial [Arachis hypogaea]
RSQILMCVYMNPPDVYNFIVESVLEKIGFYHLALVERWHPETYTFYLLIGKCAAMLEDTALILGLPITGLPMTR